MLFTKSSAVAHLIVPPAQGNREPPLPRPPQISIRTQSTTARRKIPPPPATVLAHPIHTRIPHPRGAPGWRPAPMRHPSPGRPNCGPPAARAAPCCWWWPPLPHSRPLLVSAHRRGRRPHPAAAVCIAGRLHQCTGDLRCPIDFASTNPAGHSQRPWKPHLWI